MQHRRSARLGVPARQALHRLHSRRQGGDGGLSSGRPPTSLPSVNGQSSAAPAGLAKVATTPLHAL